MKRTKTKSHATAEANPWLYEGAAPMKNRSRGDYGLGAMVDRKETKSWIDGRISPMMKPEEGRTWTEKRRTLR